MRSMYSAALVSIYHITKLLFLQLGNLYLNTSLLKSAKFSTFNLVSPRNPVTEVQPPKPHTIQIYSTPKTEILAILPQNVHN